MAFKPLKAVTLYYVKLHRNLADAIVATLAEIFDNNQVAERAVAASFEKHPKWGKRDRSFVAATVYEIVRWRRLLEFAAQDESNWALLAAQMARAEQALPDWDEFKPFNAAWLRTRLQIPEIERAVVQSIPDWIDELGERELGERWPAEIAALNREAPVVLRANTLKTSRDELRARLSELGFETTLIENLPDALQLSERKAVTRTELYKAGLFEIQDAASQMVAPFADAVSGMKVLDACAGAGGKTLHLAAQINNQGELRALDVSESKLVELTRRATRAGANVSVALANEKSLKQLRGWADRLILDMPCSGTGTLRRQPDLKWRLSPEWLERLRVTQREILRDYRTLVADGGEIVYATCSILPSENGEQIAWFVGEFPEWELREERVVSTAQTGFDGFYMARLGRNFRQDEQDETGWVRAGKSCDEQAKDQWNVLSSKVQFS